MLNTSPINFDDSLLDDFVSGETLKNACGSYFKPTAFDPSMSLSNQDNGTVFCKTEAALGEFFQLMRKNPDANRRVVTHNSDIGIDAEFASMRPPNVTKWYAVNSTHDDPMIVPVPLGIANSHCVITTKISHIKAVDTKASRSRLLYINHRPQTYPIERQPLMDAFTDREKQGEKWFTIGSNRKGQTETDRGGGASDGVIRSFLTEMIDHKFVLCPRGNGLDTHRLWEALYSRTIPIARYEDGHRNFIDLPILFINDWCEVTEEFLHTKYEEMSTRKWDYSKITASYWAKEFS